ncbi:MAG: sulfatase-like hydrolase/transferase [Tannerella sp.]|jgi:heptose-I-phosphate ethanolaminephosphotransferase|nr:sulfatase-like hydrolase/transferase [Tannerella sp.]
MKINLRIKERKLQLFFLVYILLLVPTISLIAQNIPSEAVIPGICVSTVLSAVIFILTTFLTTKGLRIFYSVLLVAALIPGAVLLGYLLFAEVLLSEGSLTTLFETNAGESKEFIVHYMNPWVSLGIALYILVPFVFIFRMKNMVCPSIREHKKTFTVCISLLFLFLTVKPVAQHIYFVDFYRIFADYKIRTASEEKAIESRRKQQFDVALSEDGAPQTLVVVIGESLTRRHMSLYGYGRETNPLLAARKSSLKVYRDVVSPQVHTIPVMRSILTFADEAHPEYLTDRPSLFELFNRAGYETCLISNQPFEDGSSSYEPLLQLADRAIDLSETNEPDGVLLKAFEQALESDKRKLIVLHLMGSHAVYKFRYPPSFNRFNHHIHPLPPGQQASRLTAGAPETIDQYDNSVLYNDYVVSRIIDLMEQRDEPSAMVYFSDHGEEVYDFRNFAGHAYEKISTFMCEIPFIVWTSGKFARKRKDLIYEETRPFSTMDALHSLADMGGLRFDGYDSGRSLFSPHFIPRERTVGDLIYDDVKLRTDEEKMREPAIASRWAALKNLILSGITD